MDLEKKPSFIEKIYGSPKTGGFRTKIEITTNNDKMNKLIKFIQDNDITYKEEIILDLKKNPESIYASPKTGSVRTKIEILINNAKMNKLMKFIQDNDITYNILPKH